MLKVEKLSFSYDKKSGDILRNISFQVPDGQLCAVLGVNGIGKSTLLKCLDRILRPGEGQVEVNGQDVFELSRREAAKLMAFVPQSAGAEDICVYDMVLLGRKPYIQWDAGEADHRLAAEAIEKLGLREKSLSPLTELSGGEAQKVLLARALVQQPQLLLLDEPTSNLDPKNQHQALRLIRDIVKEQNISALVVLHDLNLALRYCDSFLFLKDGQVCSFGGRESVTEALLEEIYGMKVKLLEYEGTAMIMPV